ncbi:MAG: sugar phosphate isomerase/epimerase [Candidatus Wallbacteria bacterium]
MNNKNLITDSKNELKKNYTPRIYLSHGSLYDYQLMPFFNIASKCGFDGAEIIVGRNRELSDISFIKFLSKKYNVPVMVLHCPFNSWKNEYWPNKPHEKLMKTVEMARALEAKVVVAHTALSGETEYKNWLTDELPAFQEKYPDVRIAIENMPRRYVLFGNAGRFIFNFKKIPFRYRRKITYDIATHTSDKDIFNPVEIDILNNSLNGIEHLNKFNYLTIDTTHLGTWGCAPGEFADQINTKIAHVHLSNYKLGIEHRLPNDGMMKFNDFFEKLKGVNYDGGITIECDPNAFRNHRNFDETRTQLIENMKFIRSCF